MSKLNENIETIEQSIQETCDQVGRSRSEVNLVAVTKSVSSKRATEVIEAGITQLGENRAEGLEEKLNEVEVEAEWHFIGNLQSRKVRDIVNRVTYLHSLSRLSIAKEVQKRAEKSVNCFIQVNVSGEESKSGVMPDELIHFIESLEPYDKVRVVGLMTMAPHTDDEQEIRPVFSQLRELRNQVRDLQLEHAPCTELSMGMSNDYKIAIEEGATFLRIGTALVGTETESRG